MEEQLITEVNNYLKNHKKELNQEVGNIIKKYRTMKKISTEKLANRICVSQPYVIQLEKGDVGISLNRFIMICNALEINLNEILDDFLFCYKSNEDMLYKVLQEDKNISKNILQFIKSKK